MLVVLRICKPVTQAGAMSCLSAVRFPDADAISAKMTFEEDASTGRVCESSM